jgi:hypothetical protein
MNFRSGSTDPIENGSNPDMEPDPQPCLRLADLVEEEDARLLARLTLPGHRGHNSAQGWGTEVTWGFRVAERKDTEEGRIQKEVGYRRMKDTEEGKIQKKEGYRRRKDTEEGRIQKKEGYRRRKDTKDERI